MNKFSSLISLSEFILHHSSIPSNEANDLFTIFNDIKQSCIEIFKIMQLSGLNDIVGNTGNTNTHGDNVRKLDLIADDIIKTNFSKNKLIAAIASEENPEIVHFNHNLATAKYICYFDPLDGSMNSDSNISTGSIFSIYRLLSESNCINDSFLQLGRNQVAAIYVVYGVALKLVYTVGDGAYEFTYLAEDNDFYLTSNKMKAPIKGFQYCCNEANSHQWESKYHNYINYIKDIQHKDKYISRYVATVVVDVHRLIHSGGIYIYPATAKNKTGKIRLNYEANALAYILEQAGGKAISDHLNILDIIPTSIHQTIPFFVGSIENIDEFISICKQ